MRFLSAILIVFGSMGVVFQLIYGVEGGEISKGLGLAIGFAVVFLLPGVLLYLRSSKTTDG